MYLVSQYSYYANITYILALVKEERPQKGMYQNYWQPTVDMTYQMIKRTISGDVSCFTI